MRTKREPSSNRASAVAQGPTPRSASPRPPPASHATNRTAAAQSCTSMRALWESSLATSSKLTIAEPLTYLPDIRVLLQGPIREEQTLSALIRRALRSGTLETMAALREYLRKTAVGLAELHHSGVRCGTAWSWADELANVREEKLEPLSRIAPHVADAAAPLLERLQALDHAYPSDPPGPAHGTFRPAQVLLSQGRIGFIDFDGFCQAEPAMDLALFRSPLKDKGMRMLYDEG